MSDTCYLIVEIDPRTMKVEAVNTYSEPPWTITRDLGVGHTIYALVHSITADDYQEALDEMYFWYPRHEHDLAVLFPLEV
jgi:hypothetical protein